MKQITAIAILICLLFCSCAVNSESPRSTPLETSPATEKPSDPPTEKPTEKPTEPPSVEELAEKRIRSILNADLKADSASIDVDEILQYPELPTGCESVALTMALNALGCDLEKTGIAENYLEYNANYAIGYCGDPFSDGGAGIWPPGMVKTVRNFARETGAEVFAYDTAKESPENLCKLVAAGYPVLVWTTYYMSEPMYTKEGVYYNDEFYAWYDNEHCVTLYGYDKKADTVDIADPLRGKITVDAERFWRINADIGGWSMVVIDTSDLNDHE